ncbi:MAG: alcohol dehydrogenase [Herpetosiphonaceae bacterium]|nr:MAG: alcohol dehydrogenase [Herpetosiphonaceae bacterium]
MKAAFFREHGPVEVLEYAELPDPVPGPGEALVRVRAVALNHLDLHVRRGLPGLKLQLPHIGGSDIAGEVAALGEGITGWEPGDRVVVNPSVGCGQCEWCVMGEESMCVRFRIIGEHMPGGTAEYVTVPAANLYKIPADYPFEQAAAAPLVFATAWRALITQGRLRAGESVLIVGAGGGVATAAIQIARLAGAKVFAASRSREKLERARELGADELLDSGEDFSREIWMRTGKRGVDVVLENVGAVTWERSLRSLGRGGRLVTYGATTGPQVPIDVRQVFWKQYSISGSTMSNRHEFATVMRLVFWERRIQPVVDRVLPLSEIREAHRLLESAEQFGKVVLTP